jgi:CheY-like chemotaxis protein
VIEAADGQEAVEIFKRLPSKIGLVILDLTMPRKSGWEAFEEIRRLRSSVAVVVSTGYSLEGGEETALRRGARAFLPKPYRAQELLQVVAGVFDEPAEPETGMEPGDDNPG